jgi:4-amino-4-deoxy-L-arabinose transferase-like glycosyltransferase
VLAPALALTFLLVVWRARAWRVLRTPWPWLAPVAGVVAYSPVLIYNLTNNLAGVERVQTRRNYAYETQLTWEKYWQNQGDLWLELARIVSNPMRIPAERAHYLTSPFMLLMVGLSLVGIGLLAWRRQPLPLCALLCTALIMPAFNKAYGQTWDRYMLTGRYVTFLLPLAFIAAGVAILALLGLLARVVPGEWQRPTPRRVLVVAAGVVLTLLILYPLQPLSRYYTHEAAKDPANASFLATIAFLRETRAPRTPIVIGRLLAKVDSERRRGRARNLRRAARSGADATHLAAGHARGDRADRRQRRTRGHRGAAADHHDARRVLADAGSAAVPARQ